MGTRWDLSRALEPLYRRSGALKEFERNGWKRDPSLAIVRRTGGSRGPTSSPAALIEAGVLPDRHRRHGRSAPTLDLEWLHHERKLMHPLRRELVELEVLEEMHAV